MAFPVVWWKAPFFYPIGNTPPTCHSRNLSPEESAQILLLGCGDPRSILHTIHSDLGAPSRKLDFTCCDLETAVLGSHQLHTWRIFYHFFLDDDSLELLLAQCRKLVQSSSDLATWNASKYGMSLRFCTEESMLDIRLHWELYLATQNLSLKEKNVLQQSFSSQMKEILQENSGFDMSSVRSAGPLANPEFLEAANQCLKTFWSTGVMAGRSSPNTPATHINPMFAYSLAGQVFNIHYGTNPISAFHLAPALTCIQGAPTPPPKIAAEDLVETAMKQFESWGDSFRTRWDMVNPSITIRFFSGECLRFCQALRRCHMEKLVNTGIHARPWGMSRINFTGDYNDSSPTPAPLLFNLIDTSNLTDHIGLLNLLVVTVPLLQQNPWSVLQTNTLVRSTPGETITSALVDRSLADIPTLSLFLGVVPSSYLSHFTTHSQRDEELVAGFADSMSGQFHQLISWKYPSSTTTYSVLSLEYRECVPSLVCDEYRLGSFLFSIYSQMFANEDLMVNVTRTSILRSNITYYIRASFIEFLSFVRSRVKVDWTKTIDHFLGLVESDGRLVFLSSYQDLVCQLYLSNHSAPDTLRWWFLESRRSAGDCFEGWDTVPPVVSVTLKVPRQHLKVLEDLKRSEIGMPVLFCDTRGRSQQNFHSSIHPTFGDFVVSGHNADAQVMINEDASGWQGTSPLIVSFDAPSWLFTKVGGMQTVCLCLRPTPHNATILYPKFGGFDTRIFSASLTDHEHLCITRCRPNDPRDICRPDDGEPKTKTTDGKKTIGVKFDMSGTRIDSLILRENIVDGDAVVSLARGASVSTKVVTDTAILVSIQDYKRLFSYPFPIQEDKFNTRIARKSSYIEIEAQIRTDSDNTAKILLNLFPIARTETSFNLLNIQYVNLSILPALQLPSPENKTEWLSPHLALSFDDRERKTQRSGVYETNGMIVNLKESIITIILEFAGLRPPFATSKVFGLSNPTVGIYALIFINELRLDTSSQTVVADACVIPVTERNFLQVDRTMKSNSEQGCTSISTLDDEVMAWKALLPAFAERCRTWKHKDSCEYRKRGIPACRDGVWDKCTSPLCQCGLGKNLGAFTKVASWKNVHSEATRIAIGPLFPLSFLKKDILDSDVSKAKSSGDAAACGYCGGPGLPNLLVCTRCKKMKYCSKNCQKGHWKTHKLHCPK